MPKYHMWPQKICDSSDEIIQNLELICRADSAPSNEPKSDIRKMEVSLEFVTLLTEIGTLRSIIGPIISEVSDVMLTSELGG